MKRDPLAGGWRNATPSGGNESLPRPQYVAELFGNMLQCYSVSFGGQRVWEGVPQLWGLCTPHTWGHPNTTQLFCIYIYIRLFTHCNFAVYSGIFRYSQHFCSCTNSGYNCRIIHSVRQKQYTLYFILCNQDLFVLPFRHQF